MPIIAQQERDTYDNIWALDAYSLHSPGAEFLPVFLSMEPRPSTILDAGCGTGRASLALAERGFIPTLCDITDEGLADEARRFPFHRVCLWDNISRAVGFHDYVYCCDVMEHIPTEFTMLVVTRLLQVARRGAFLSVCHVTDNFGQWHGTPLHKTVQSFVWWRDNLREIADVVEARDMLTTGAFFVRPR